MCSFYSQPWALSAANVAVEERRMILLIGVRQELGESGELEVNTLLGEWVGVPVYISLVYITCFYCELRLLAQVLELVSILGDNEDGALRTAPVRTKQLIIHESIFISLL